MSDQRTCAHPHIHGKRVLEMPFRVVPVGQRHGQKTEAARGGTVTGGSCTDHDDTPGVGKEQLVQQGSTTAVLKKGADIGKKNKSGQPLLVLREIGEAVHSDPLKLLSCPIPVAQLS